MVLIDILSYRKIIVLYDVSLHKSSFIDVNYYELTGIKSAARLPTYKFDKKAS